MPAMWQVQVRGLCSTSKVARKVALRGHPTVLQEDSGGRSELHVLRPRTLLPLHQRQSEGGDRPRKGTLLLHRQSGGRPLGNHDTPTTPDPLPNRLPSLGRLCQNDRVSVRQVHGLWLPVSEFIIFIDLGGHFRQFLLRESELDCSRVTASTQSTDNAGEETAPE